jgi:RNA polymerase sigma factor (sigma-70 family)
VPADESCARESVIRAVRDCLGTLKNAEEKEAILLYYLAGRVYREIGETCGASISMVRKRIASAREKLKACLERKGITAFPP